MPSALRRSKRARAYIYDGGGYSQERKVLGAAPPSRQGHWQSYLEELLPIRARAYCHKTHGSYSFI